MSLYSDADQDSFERELEKDTDYVYLSDRNVIRFEETQMPPSQWYIQARYTVLAVGATSEESSEESEESEETEE